VLIDRPIEMSTLDDSGWLRASKGGFMGDSPRQRNVRLNHKAISARTVNLSHTLAPQAMHGIAERVACERAGPVQIASTYWWLQRFFQHINLSEGCSTRLGVQRLGLTGAWYSFASAGRTGRPVHETSAS
jgi:hypothetical protein